MLNKIIGVIIAIIGMVILSLHNESYAFDRLDQDTPLTTPTKQTCSTNAISSQLCWKDGSNCLDRGTVTPVVEPAEMATIKQDTQPQQVTAIVDSADQQNNNGMGVLQYAPTATTSPADESTLNADLIFSMINQYRRSVGLPPFVKDPQVCAVTDSRAPELYNEIMVTHTMHRGFYAKNLPYWATENIIYMNSEQAAVTWWLNEPIHHAAIVSNYQYSCVSCAGKSCSQIFTSFQPK